MSKGYKSIMVDGLEARRQFGEFMKGEKIYEIILDFENPKTGEIFKLPIKYTPATAFDIQNLYADMDPKADVEEQLLYTMELFNFCVKDIRFVNVPRGTANYENGEISMQDLMIDQKLMLEKAVAPGTGKTGEELEQKLADSRRKVGKGMRRRASKVDAATDGGVSL